MSVIGRLTNERWLSGLYGRRKSKNKNRELAKIKATARRKIYIMKRLGLARGKFYQFRPYHTSKNSTPALTPMLLYLRLTPPGLTTR